MNDMEMPDMEAMGWAGESNEVSQEKIDQVKENQKKAKKIRWQIKSSQIKNKKEAKMLAIIFNIKSDKILKFVLTLLQNDIDIKVIFGIFVPLLEKDVKEKHESLKKIIKKYDRKITSLKDYGEFINKNITTHDKIQKLNQDQFTNFIKDILYHFNINNLKKQKDKAQNSKQFDKDLFQTTKNTIY